MVSHSIYEKRENEFEGIGKFLKPTRKGRKSKRPIQFATLMILFFSIAILGQTDKNITSSKNELSSVKKKITQLEKELKSNELNKKATIQVLDKINHQTHLVNKIIKDLAKEEKILDSKISGLSSKIRDLEKQIDDLKKDYSAYVKWIYVNGKDAKWNYLFHSGSINQAIIRYKYFNYITKKNEERLDELVQKKTEYENLSKQLSKEKVKKKEVEKEKKVEASRLVKREAEKTKIIAELNKNKNNLEKEIEEKRKYEIEIKSRIAKLIEEARERERKLREARFKNNSTKPISPKINYSKFENFSELKGKMNWPVNSGKIVRKFGENRDPKLKTVTINYGVDISSRKAGDVVAVAEGEVSVIDWIPGFGSIIIITHKGNFRTVYGHIDNILVNEGDVIKGGTKLGTINRSLEGNILHFEIWDERNYKNPQKWLAKK